MQCLLQCPLGNKGLCQQIHLENACLNEFIECHIPPVQVASQGEWIKIAGFHTDFLMKPISCGAYFEEAGYNG